MKNFYMKYKKIFVLICNILLIILSIFAKRYIFTVLGVFLLGITLYTFKFEKKQAELEAQKKAEKEARKAEQKRLNKGKKKKKKKRK